MIISLSRMRSYILGCLLMVACGGSDQARRGAENVNARKDALAASTSLSQAVSGRVNPVPGVSPGGSIAAAITGTVDVEHNGSASYRFPVWVPEGVRGMQPVLGVEYNSHKGAGILGPKWSVTGLSAIVRCGKRLPQDGISRPVNLTNGDTFCLDGERLVRISGQPEQFGEFRTELNPFRKISVIQTNPLNGIEGFQVIDPGGRTFYYGTKAASRLNVNAPGKTLYYAYYLDKVIDRYGNSILFTYRRDFEFTAGTKWAQELVPDRITWGSTEDTARTTTTRS